MSEEERYKKKTSSLSREGVIVVENEFMLMAGEYKPGDGGKLGWWNLSRVVTKVGTL